MKLDYTDYWSTKSGVSTMEMKKRLPPTLRDSLLQDGRFSEGIYTDTSNRNLIQALDKHFKIGRKKHVCKQRHIEIDENEINNFSYFKIMPRQFEMDQHVYCDYSRPTCKFDPCPWGSEIQSPISINVKKVRNLGIAQIDRLWRHDVELLLSPKVIELFEAENITGLEYEPCLTRIDNKDIKLDKPFAYFARVSNGTSETADDINLPKYCKDHKTIIAYLVYGLRVQQSAILNYDIFKFDRLIVKDKTFRYYVPSWVVSQKVLRLLLDNKVPGLRELGWALGQKFIPLVIEDMESSCKGLANQVSQVR